MADHRYLIVELQQSRSSLSRWLLKADADVHNGPSERLQALLSVT